jgi:4-carboxymuconolactone decarboxylase
MHLPRPAQPRIPPVPRVLERLRGEGHGGANLYATLATNKRVSNAMAVVFGVFYGDSAAVEPRLRELTTLRMSWNVGSEYIFGQHTTISRNLGMTDDEIVLTTRPLSCGKWEARDEAVLRMTDELYLDDCVTDATWALLTEQFTPETIMALMAVPQMYRMAAGIFNTFGVELDEGVPSWPGAV